jgi:hypothetical protein
MHLDYDPGDMMMIDFAGKKINYVDQTTGELIACHVFVAVLPFSGLIFCHAVHSQKTHDFTLCINAMLRFYGGVSATILCDNMRTAVTKPDRYEPVFTDICMQLSEHYQTTFSATRPYSPKDKAMVEKAVNIVYRHVYAPLRNRTFTSLTSLNEAMQEQLMFLNHKSYKKSPHSRWYFFEQQEKSLLKVLPSEPFNIKKVSTLTVQRNYHIQLSDDHRYYSVPYQYVGKKVKVLYDARLVEIYLEHQRIAFHVREPHRKAYITMPEHMPPNHEKMLQVKGWTRPELLDQAQAIGPATHRAATLMLQNSIYIAQNYKACFGMLMLHKRVGKNRLEAACARALNGSRVNYTMIKNILDRGLDSYQASVEMFTTPKHSNIRGKDHYQ